MKKPRLKKLKRRRYRNCVLWRWPLHAKRYWVNLSNDFNPNIWKIEPAITIPYNPYIIPQNEKILYEY